MVGGNAYRYESSTLARRFSRVAGQKRVSIECLRTMRTRQAQALSVDFESRAGFEPANRIPVGIDRVEDCRSGQGLGQRRRNRLSLVPEPSACGRKTATHGTNCVASNQMQQPEALEPGTSVPSPTSAKLRRGGGSRATAPGRRMRGGHLDLNLVPKPDWA